MDNLAKSFAEFFSKVNSLKSLYRTGSLAIRARTPESVSQHAFRLSLLAFLLARKLGCNREKLLEMALVHDIHESVCGDITEDFSEYGHQKGLRLEEKTRLEKNAAEELAAMLPKEESEVFLSLWGEAENGGSVEARALRELDILELLYQISEFRRRGEEGNALEIFLKVNSSKIKAPFLRQFLDAIVQRALSGGKGVEKASERRVETPVQKLIELLDFTEELRRLPRTGWVKNGVKNAESVSDHSFHTALAAFFLAGRIGAGRGRLAEMALLHDLHESVSGDLVLDYSKFGGQPSSITPEEKERKEEAGMEKICGLLEEVEAADYRQAWIEAKRKQTVEARALAEIDKFEMLFQAADYQRRGNGRKDLLEVFLKANKQWVRAPLLKQILGGRLEGNCFW